MLKQTRTKVKVKQRKNGDFYADVSKIDLPFEKKTVSRNVKSAMGNVYKSLTVVATWYDNPNHNTIVTEWDT